MSGELRALCRARHSEELDTGRSKSTGGAARLLEVDL